jgi:hypothetical protein
MGCFAFPLVTPASASTPNVNAYYGPVKGSSTDAANFTIWNGTTYVSCTTCGKFYVANDAVRLQMRKGETFVSGSAEYLDPQGTTAKVMWLGGAVPLKMKIRLKGGGHETLTFVNVSGMLELN